MNLFNPPKYVLGDLVGLDGNAGALLGYFRKHAKRAKWSEADINKVIEAATSKDYNHLLQVLMSHLTEDPKDILSNDFKAALPKELQNELDSFITTKFDELVPESDKTDTVHGELIRAFCNIRYQWYNNGVHFLVQEESPSGSAEWIYTHTDKSVQELFDSFALAGSDDKEHYENFLYLLSQKLKRFIENNENKPNSEDSLDSEGRWKFIICDECSALTSPSFTEYNACANAVCKNCYENEKYANAHGDDDLDED